jgi:3-hydroxybutyryl-CoA dehydrogenase
VGEQPQAIGVVGGGTMGTGIAYVFALAGFATTVVEPNDERAAQMHVEIAGAANAAVQRGKLDANGASALRAGVRRVASVGELTERLDLVVETVPERVELKLAVLREIDLRRPLLVASNTSSISIDSLAGAVRSPAEFLGMHFFNPVWSLGLVELIRGSATSPGALLCAQTFVEQIGKQSITVADVPGFATSRLDLIASLEAMRMVEDGVTSAEDIDRAAELAYRHPVGPLRLSDIVGLDVRLDIARQLERAHGERFRPPQILIDLVAAGRLGRKSGHGFYEWPA